MHQACSFSDVAAPALTFINKIPGTQTPVTDCRLAAGS